VISLRAVDHMPAATHHLHFFQTKECTPMSIVPRIADMNHANSLNLTEFVAAGGWAIIHKSLQGPGFKDPAYRFRIAAAEQLGLLVGAYDFATHDDVAANVTAFLGTAVPDKSMTVALNLDFEDNSHSEMSGDQAWEFLDRVHQAGFACDIYGGNRIREHIDHQQAKWVDMAKVARLWQCRYIGKQPDDNAGVFAAIPPIPPWTENFIIQYAADGLGPRPHAMGGLENGADLNVVRFAAKDELAKVWAGPPRAITA
jgi:hypothetical protein